MQFPNWLKVLWWAILFIGIGLLFRERLPDLLSGHAAAADVAVFGIWMALLLTPLFSEVALLGVTLKNEIEELKGNVAMQLTDLRADIRNAIDVKTTISQTFHQPSPPPDAQLPALEAQVKSAVAAAFAEQGKTATAPAPLAVSDDIALLFATRYHIETELRRVATGRDFGANIRRPAPVFLLSRSLVESGLLSPKLGNAIRDGVLRVHPGHSWRGSLCRASRVRPRCGARLDLGTTRITVMTINMSLNQRHHAMISSRLALAEQPWFPNCIGEWKHDHH